MQKKIIAGLEKAIQFAIWGGVGGALGALLSEPTSLMRQQSGSGSLTESVIMVGTWFGIIGAAIAVTLLIASSQYLKRGLQLKQALKDGVWVGFLAGAIAGGIAQYTYRSIGPTEFLRVICWGLAGGLLGLGLSFRIPNLGQIRGMGGGLVGGLLGGTLFVLVAFISAGSNIAARLSGVAAIGFCIGLMIVIAEAAFREAWLEIYYGPKEMRTVSLGSQPIAIGSDSENCTIYARNAPPVALRYRLQEGKIFCENLSTNSSYQIQPGDRETVGNLTIVVSAATPQPSPPVANTYAELPSPSPPSPEPSDKAPKQFSLQVKRRAIALSIGTDLQPQDLPGLEPSAGSRVVAQVTQNPQDPSILGLQNCTNRSWTATLPNGQQREIKPGRNLKLSAGTQIDFGPIKGEIYDA